MFEWLTTVTEYAVVVIDWIALIIILFGTLEAFIGVLRSLRNRNAIDSRAPWLRFARWLIAGLTFQLAADIIATAIRSDWKSIGQLGAIAIIRTFLNYFLEQDVEAHRGRVLVQQGAQEQT